MKASRVWRIIVLLTGFSIPTVAQQTYQYRILRFDYPASEIGCWCGELRLENSDREVLNLKTPMIPLPGYDTTLDFINSSIMTETFKLQDTTILRLYRNILPQHIDSSYVNEDLPDTTWWTIVIHDAWNGNRLATLDSIGSYPVLTGKRYPYLFGDDTVHTDLEFNLAGIRSLAVDSCYLVFTMHRSRSDTTTINAIIDVALGWRVSSYFSMGSAKARSSTRRPDISDRNLELAVYPNPVRDYARVRIGAFLPGVYTIGLEDIAGRLIREVNLGMLSANEVSECVVSFGDEPAGRYTLSVRKNGVTLDRKLIVKLK